jgi:hypothetical protein
MPAKRPKHQTATHEARRQNADASAKANPQGRRVNSKHRNADASTKATPKKPKLRHCPQPLPKTNHRISNIPKRLIKSLHIGFSAEHLQIHLRTPARGKRGFSMPHEQSPNPKAPGRRLDSKRIQPASMPVIPSHHSSNDSPILHGNKEQFRLRSELIPRRQNSCHVV